MTKFIKKLENFAKKDKIQRFYLIRDELWM